MYIYSNIDINYKSIRKPINSRNILLSWVPVAVSKNSKSAYKFMFRFTKIVITVTNFSLSYKILIC